MTHDIAVSLATIALVNVLSWLTPGPNMLAVISASVSNGRRAGLMTGLGLNAGGLVWACMAVMGVTSLFELFPQFILWFKLAGAAYLLWLGFRAIQARSNGCRQTAWCRAIATVWLERVSNRLFRHCHKPEGCPVLRFDPDGVCSRQCSRLVPRLDHRDLHDGRVGGSHDHRHRVFIIDGSAAVPVCPAQYQCLLRSTVCRSRPGCRVGRLQTIIDQYGF